MSAKIRIRETEAEISDVDGRWHCDDKQLQASLNELLQTHAYSGADPNPALTIANEAVAALGGEVVSYDETDTDELIVKE